jgi:hypothetical protein
MEPAAAGAPNLMSTFSDDVKPPISGGHTKAPPKKQLNLRSLA